MTYMQQLFCLTKYLRFSLRQLSCCDLCGSNIESSILFEQEIFQTLLCQNCLNDLPIFHQNVISSDLLNWPAINKALPKIAFDHLFALSPYIYPFNQWLVQLKYLNRFEISKLFSALLCAQWQSSQTNLSSSKVDLVISVPLHLKKWQVRGYNQAHLIAQAFAKQLSLPYDDGLIKRIKHNDSQMGKTGPQRRRNLANAFQLEKPLPKNVKRIIIVDDVVTTGSTASEISKILKSAGVETISLVAVCLTLPKIKKVQKTNST